MLLLLLACATDEGGVHVAGPGDSDSAGAAPVDADGDGADATVDCDDTDPTVHPDAPEQCDARDQDCDGLVDEDIPSDGAGCVDPGPPVLPSTVDTVQITIETATSTNADSDDPLYVCLGDWCELINIADWDDRELGNFDVLTYEEAGLARDSVTGFQIYTTDGPDRWHPMGFAVSFDGEGVYTRSPEDLYIGDEASNEVTEWSDALGNHDDTIWPSPLTHGPMNGAPFAGGARVWLRTDRTRRVELRVAVTAADLPAAAPVATRYPGPATDFTEVIDVFGLAGAAEWAYDLTLDGVTYGPWTLVPGPADGAPGVRRVAFGSCTSDQEQPIFEQIRAAEPDLFLFVGDNHYGNTGELNALRQQYRWAHSRSGRAELLRETSIYATWDDHDYTGNDEDGSAEGKEEALRVFTEYWANGAYGLPELEGVFSAHTYGDIGIWLLDGRYWRGLDGTLLGVEQEAWLLESVAASPAVFKLVVGGSQFNLDGSADSWASFPAAQARVVDALSEIGGVVLLSGDIHTSEIVPVPASAYDVPELTSSPLAYNGTAKVIYLDIDTTAPDPTLTARIVDGDGEELDRWDILRSALE
ncbi:MAG: hypothetical protein EXR69_14800 [Myxococcales bacterium]|nr:hypothetical protein [Myxococcales bacterium]